MAKNPVEEFLMEKKAFGSKLKGMAQKAAPTLARMGEQAGTAALAGGAAAGFAGLVGAAGRLFDAATKTRDFNSMLEANPDLHSHLEQDPGGFNRMFTSLRRFSPEFTKDPLVAGSLMRQGMESAVEDRGNLVIRSARDRTFPKAGPATEAALGGYMKGFGGGGEAKKPQLQRQTKSVFGAPGEGQEAPPLQRIEETVHQYG